MQYVDNAMTSLKAHNKTLQQEVSDYSKVKIPYIFGKTTRDLTNFVDLSTTVSLLYGIKVLSSNYIFSKLPTKGQEWSTYIYAVSVGKALANLHLAENYLYSQWLPMALKNNVFVNKCVEFFKNRNEHLKVVAAIFLTFYIAPKLIAEVIEYCVNSLSILHRANEIEPEKMSLKYTPAVIAACVIKIIANSLSYAKKITLG